ncbi:unnamed protein product [Cylicocyclus nassatus]|uniref:Gelsolin-like domain-containing protein n=1 Tax=Cylicocyclus nassatus TaxID=53992 RepID=A0AA36GM90_CYLNA|nr:unnamed protein product [Cylicocyclus nassatus]
MSQDVDTSQIGQKDGLEIYRINKFKLEEVPKEDYGQFYSGDSYVVLYTKYKGACNIHFWLGEKTSIDEMGTAAIKSQQIDEFHGGMPVQYREVQFHESPLFLSYFPNGIRYLDGGVESGYNIVEDPLKDFKPRLYHCKGKRNVRWYQVECKKESLNLGDVFVLDLGRTVYVWMPPASGRLEKIKGMMCAKEIADKERHGEAQVKILDSDWDKDEEFWSHFGGLSSAKNVKRAMNDDQDYWRKISDKVTLYKVSDESGDMKVMKIQGPAKQTELNTKDAFILDAATGGIFVWIGKECSAIERISALQMGEKFLKLQMLPPWTQVTRVMEGAETMSFMQWFEEWDEEKQRKCFVPQLFQVSNASGKLVIEEIANFTQENLDGDDVMILDALHSIYVWVGAGADPKEKEGAQETAKKYLKQDTHPRHKDTTIETIYQGKETPTFKKFFPKWDDQLFQSGNRSVEKMRKLLFH